MIEERFSLYMGSRVQNINGVRRNREDIIFDILNSVDNNTNRISLIMKYVNLSGLSARKYLDYLMKSGMLEEYNGEYKLTDKGRKVLELLREKRKIEIELGLVFMELADLLL